MINRTSSIVVKVFIRLVRVRCEDAYSGSKYEGHFDLGGFMIQLIVNVFVEKEKTGAVVEVLYASSDHEKVKAKYERASSQYPENYFSHL